MPAGMMMRFQDLCDDPHVRAAGRVHPSDRPAIFAGEKRLIPQPRKPRKPSLPAAWISSTEEERINAICSLGPDRVARVLAIAQHLHHAKGEERGGEVTDPKHCHRGDQPPERLW